MYIRETAIAATLALLGTGLAGCDDAKPQPEEQPAAKASDREPVRYDSEACSKPANGKVYVQIGVDIYGFDQEWPIILGGPSNFPPLPGIQETEPEGCPSNPIRTSVVRFAFRYEALRDNKANPRPRMNLQGMGLIDLPEAGVEYSGWRSIKNGWNREKSTGKCSNDESIEVCGRIIQGRWYGFARVDKESYSTPQGDDFLMDCSRFMGHADCGNAYPLNLTSALYYNFQKKDKDFKDILEFDKALREFLAKSICDNCLNTHEDE